MGGGGESISHMKTDRQDRHVVEKWKRIKLYTKKKYIS